MRKLFSFIYCGFLILYSSVVFAQVSPPGKLALTLKRQIELNHYSPIINGDSLSTYIFNTFIDLLDDERKILLEQDYKDLKEYHYKLDDEISRGEWIFPVLAEKIFRKRLRAVDSITSVILAKPIAFRFDQLTLRGEEKVDFAPDYTSLRSRWEEWIQYVLLSRAYNQLITDSINHPLQVFFQKNEAGIREKLRKDIGRAFTSVKNEAELSDDIRELYLYSIASAYDPHTAYFTPLQKTKFESDLGAMDFAYGFEISEEKTGQVFIAAIVPGGPAWRSGELHKKDKLLQLQWKGEKPVDVTELNADEVESLISRSKIDQLSMKVKKADGTIRTVQLVREKIESEEEVVKGYVLSGETPVGYISLPDFYTKWEDDQGSSCANDLAREIILLKKENIEGLILDLRYNGGGSMHEALQLAGIFINEGPLSGYRKKDGKVNFLRDPNRGTIYDGPLVVLVNSESASASELVAATLQDHNRAVVAGSITYGKATIQSIFPMDSTKKQGADSPDGFIKITTGKLYRVSGTTAQSTGVQPDIVLPDAFDGMETGERFQKRALPPDLVEKNKYYQPLPPLPIASLQASSSQRLKVHPGFISLLNFLKEESLGKGKITIPIRPNEFQSWMKLEEKKEKVMEEGDTNIKIFMVRNHREAQSVIQPTAYQEEINKATLGAIQTDMYVEEAFLIVLDLIKLTTRIK